MVVARLYEGLGNQMFQYAAAKALALGVGTELKLDLSFYQTDSLRSYDLCFFNIEAEIASPPEVAELTIIPPGFVPNLLYRIRNRLTQPMNRPFLVNESHYHFANEFAQATRRTYLTGLWQSEKYFGAIAPTIRQHFTLKDTDKEKRIEVGDLIKRSQAVAIHIRRGDYVKYSHLNLYSENLRYHYQAIDYITKRIEQPCFFIFSDDLAWVKENLRIENHPVYYPGEFYPVEEIPQRSRGPLDLMLMSICKHHIIANSTYAWWGAWLGQHSGQIVTVPQQWFGDDFLLYGKKPDTQDLIPAGWIKI